MERSGDGLEKLGYELLLSGVNGFPLTALPPFVLTPLPPQRSAVGPRKQTEPPTQPPSSPHPRALGGCLHSCGFSRDPGAGDVPADAQAWPLHPWPSYVATTSRAPSSVVPQTSPAQHAPS